MKRTESRQTAAGLFCTGVCGMAFFGLVTWVVSATLYGSAAALIAEPAAMAGEIHLLARTVEENPMLREEDLILPAEISARLRWARSSLAPSGLQKLELLARQHAPKIGSGSDAPSLVTQAKSGVSATFPGLAGTDVSQAAFIALMMSTRDMDEDLRMIMAEIKSIAAARQKLRDQIEDLNSWISQEMSKKSGHAESDLSGAPSGGARPSQQGKAASGRPMAFERATSPVIGMEYARVPVIPPLPPKDSRVTIEGLKSLRHDLKGKLEGLNEMSEMTSLRLQMAMDRRSKFIQALSNIMKKTSTTQDTLVQNIK